MVISATTAYFRLPLSMFQDKKQEFISQNNKQLMPVILSIDRRSQKYKTRCLQIRSIPPGKLAQRGEQLYELGMSSKFWGPAIPIAIENGITTSSKPELITTVCGRDSGASGLTKFIF